MTQKFGCSHDTSAFSCFSKLDCCSFLLLEMPTKIRRSLYPSWRVTWVLLFHKHEFWNKQASSTQFSFLINAFILGKHGMPFQTRRKNVYSKWRQFSFVQCFLKGVRGKLICEQAIANLDQALRELIYIVLWTSTNMTRDPPTHMI